MSPKWMFWPKSSAPQVSFGAESIFHNVPIRHPYVCRLTDTTAIVCYRYVDYGGTNTHALFACALQISGTTVTAGTPVFLQAANNYGSQLIYGRVAVTRCTDNMAIVTGLDVTTWNLSAILLTVDGLTTTPSTPTVFAGTLYSYYIDAAVIDDNRHIVAYMTQNNNFFGEARVISRDGTTLTVGSQTVFRNIRSDWVAVGSIGNNKFVVATGDPPATTTTTHLCCLEVDDMTVTSGPLVVHTTDHCGYNSVNYVEDNKALVTYGDGNSRGKARVVEADGLNLTADPFHYYNETPSTGHSSHSALIRLNSGLSTIVHSTASSGYGVDATTLLTQGTTVTPSAHENVAGNWDSARTLPSVALMDSSRSIVCYGSDPSIHGAARLLTVTGA